MGKVLDINIKPVNEWEISKDRISNAFTDNNNVATVILDAKIGTISNTFGGKWDLYAEYIFKTEPDNRAVLGEAHKNIYSNNIEQQVVLHTNAEMYEEEELLQFYSNTFRGAEYHNAVSNIDEFNNYLTQKATVSTLFNTFMENLFNLIDEAHGGCEIYSAFTDKEEVVNRKELYNHYRETITPIKQDEFKTDMVNALSSYVEEELLRLDADDLSNDNSVSIPNSLAMMYLKYCCGATDVRPEQCNMIANVFYDKEYKRWVGEARNDYDKLDVVDLNLSEKLVSMLNHHRAFMKDWAYSEEYKEDDNPPFEDEEEMEEPERD